MLTRLCLCNPDCGRVCARVYWVCCLCMHFCSRNAVRSNASLIPFVFVCVYVRLLLPPPHSLPANCLLDVYCVWRWLCVIGFLCCFDDLWTIFGFYRRLRVHLLHPGTQTHTRARSSEKVDVPCSRCCKRFESSMRRWCDATDITLHITTRCNRPRHISQSNLLWWIFSFFGSSRN